MKLMEVTLKPQSLRTPGSSHGTKPPGHSDLEQNILGWAGLSQLLLCSLLKDKHLQKHGGTNMLFPLICLNHFCYVLEQMPWRSCHSAHQDVTLKFQNALTKLLFKTTHLTHFYYWRLHFRGCKDVTPFQCNWTISLIWGIKLIKQLIFYRLKKSIQNLGFHFKNWSTLLHNREDEHNQIQLLTSN